MKEHVWFVNKYLISLNLIKRIIILSLKIISQKKEYFILPIFFFVNDVFKMQIKIRKLIKQFKIR